MQQRIPLSVLAVLGLAGAVLLFQGRGQAGHVGAPASAASSALPADELRLPAGSAALDLVQVAVAQRQVMPQSEALSARIAYDEDSTARVGSSIAGRIQQLKVQAGDRVQAGQVLALLDAPDAAAALADLEKARVDERHKEAVWRRTSALAGTESLSPREKESAEADWQQALAERRRAEARVQALHLGQLAAIGNGLPIKSPMAGVVMERNASPALEVQGGAGTPLFIIADPRRLAVWVDLPDRLLGQVRKGDTLSVEADAFPGQSFEARIEQVGPVLDPSTRRVPVRALLRDPQARLMPEMFVRAWVQSRQGAPAWRLPNTALVTRGLHTCVFVEEGPGRFRLRRVELLQRGDAMAFIGAGLKEGERVVMQGALLLNAELDAQVDARS